MKVSVETLKELRIPCDEDLVLELQKALYVLKQFVRADLKACVNIIMMITGGRDVDVTASPMEPDGVAHRLWKQTLWTIAEVLVGSFSWQYDPRRGRECG
ncbi:hypothetical protein P3T76_001715 [Phytophthora citrophthora]|uniref:Uncharacterized protein n=1 Tax=Phytophthora citrophthora TaxID=4793 RepID=A0AAD9LRZ4_9STRA|nr:hypothetical protein P3T76_001715 [Phytophthora citrophthora]